MGCSLVPIPRLGMKVATMTKSTFKCRPMRFAWIRRVHPSVALSHEAQTAQNSLVNKSALGSVCKTPVYCSKTRDVWQMASGGHHHVAGGARSPTDAILPQTHPSTSDCVASPLLLRGNNLSGWVFGTKWHLHGLIPFRLVGRMIF